MGIQLQILENNVVNNVVYVSDTGYTHGHILSVQSIPTNTVYVNKRIYIYIIKI